MSDNGPSEAADDFMVAVVADQAAIIARLRKLLGPCLYTQSFNALASIYCGAQRPCPVHDKEGE